MKDKAYLLKWQEEYTTKRDSLTEQVCTKCNKCKPIGEFAKRKLRSGIYGYEKQCKECRSHHVKVWAKKNIDIVKAYSIKDIKPKIKKVCPHCKNEFDAHERTIYCSKECRRTAGLHPRIYTRQSKEEIKEKRKQHRDNNRVKYRAYRRAYIVNRLANDIDYKLKYMISNKVRTTIKGDKQYKHSIDLLGCSVEEVRNHLQCQFTKGMSWDNWGVFGWHIDHIRPIASFDFTKEEDQRACFHYTNLQPLWWRDNVEKRDKIIEKQLILM
jgi:hypothetical protein